MSVTDLNKDVKVLDCAALAANLYWTLTLRLVLRPFYAEIVALLPDERLFIVYL